MQGANGSFLLIMLGFWGVLLEAWRPGRVVPGSVGIGAVVAGCYLLWRSSPDPFALLLLALAGALFWTEMVWNTRLVAGVIGTIALAAGFSLVATGPSRIHPALAWPFSVLTGFAVLVLGKNVRHACFNKRVDL